LFGGLCDSGETPELKLVLISFFADIDMVVSEAKPPVDQARAVAKTATAPPL
jgi:hypothetical protein